MGGGHDLRARGIITEHGCEVRASFSARVKLRRFAKRTPPVSCTPAPRATSPPSTDARPALRARPQRLIPCLAPHPSLARLHPVDVALSVLGPQRSNPAPELSNHSAGALARSRGASVWRSRRWRSPSGAKHAPHWPASGRVRLGDTTSRDRSSNMDAGGAPGAARSQSANFEKRSSEGPRRNALIARMRGRRCGRATRPLA